MDQSIWIFYPLSATPSLMIFSYFSVMMIQVIDLPLVSVVAVTSNRVLCQTNSSTTFNLTHIFQTSLLLLLESFSVYILHPVC